MQEQQPLAPQQPVTPTNTVAFGVTSMVTGILSLILTLIPILNFGLSVIAVIFGILGLKKPASKGMAIAGLVTGGLGLLSSLAQAAFWLLVILAASASATAL